MAQSLWDGLNGASLDSQQTGLAVQSLLESQSFTDPEEDEEDLFQCGKCKSQFTSLTEFVKHKKKKCASTTSQQVTVSASNSDVVSASVAVAETTASSLGDAAGGQHQNAYTALPQYSLKSQGNVINLGQATVPASPLTQTIQGVGQSFLLSDDFLTLASMDATNNLSIAFQGNPILSQVVGPLTPKPDVSSSPTPAVSNLSEASTAVVPLTQEQEITTGEPGGEGQQTLEVYTSQQEVVEQLIETSQTDVLTTQFSVPLSVVQIPSSSEPGTQQQSVVLASSGGTGSGGSIQIISLNSSKSTGTKKDGGTLLHNELAAPPEFQYITPQAPSPAPQTKTKSSTKLNNSLLSADKKNKEAERQAAGTKSKLKCSFCGKAFAKNFDLQQHVRSHTGEKPFQCIVCGRAFAQKSNVKKHMKTHKVWPKGAKTLPKEPVVFQLEQEQENMEQTAQETPASSDVWAVISQSEDGSTNSTAKTVLVNVQQTASPVKADEPALGTSRTKTKTKLNMLIDNSYNCQYCEQKFPNYFKLKTHMLEHKDEQVYKCIHKSCSETFKELDHYVEHIKTHENDMEYRCHVCSKNFSTLFDLGVHQYTHSLYPNQGSRIMPKNYKCPHCGNRYSTPAALKHHVDTTDHKYPCTTCNKVFHCERFLRRHLLTHSTNAIYVCDVCNKAFKTEHYLKQHKFVHSTDKPWQCDVCGQAYNRKDKLRRHKVIHEPTKKYKCPFKSHTGCEKAFNRADKLKAHIISHSGIKPFRCKYCDKCFSRRPHLNEHIRNHEGNFRFHCELCGKGFNRRNVLRMHTIKCSGPCARQTNQSALNNTTVSVRKNYIRHIKRKVGRPRKIISLTADDFDKKEQEKNKVKRGPGRPRKVIGLASKVPETGVSESGEGEQKSAPLVEISDLSHLQPIGEKENDSQTNTAENTESSIENADNTVPIAENTTKNTDRATLEEGQLVLQAVHAQVFGTSEQNNENKQVTISTDHVPKPLLTVVKTEQGEVNSSIEVFAQTTTDASAENQPKVIAISPDQGEEVSMATGNTRIHQSIQLMEGPDGVTYLVDEVTQQILAQITGGEIQPQNTVNTENGSIQEETTVQSGS